MGVRLGQATGPLGNPALWGKERAASPGLMGLGKRDRPHSSALCPAVLNAPTPMLAVYCRGHAPQKVERLWFQVSSLSSSRSGICVVPPLPP